MKVQREKLIKLPTYLLLHIEYDRDILKLTDTFVLEKMIRISYDSHLENLPTFFNTETITENI